MSDTSENSGSSADSSSEDNPELLARPVFLKKSKKPLKNHSSLAHILARAEYHQQIDTKEAVKEKYDSIDDTDNVDPEKEYEMWKLREKTRRNRDRRRLEEIEKEKEELLRRQRQRGTEKTGGFDKETKEANKSHLGSFYADSIEERLLKRDYKDVENRGDHSRPTKYKR